jgi:hypothetical protein
MSNVRAVVAAAVATGVVTAMLSMTAGVARATPNDDGGPLGHAIGGAGSDGDNPLHGGGGVGGSGGNANTGGL